MAKVSRACSKKFVQQGQCLFCARGAYLLYVSTEKWRERRWWLFSTGSKSGEPYGSVDAGLDASGVVSDEAAGAGDVVSASVAGGAVVVSFVGEDVDDS